jgi:hypothetical protein
MTAGIFVGITWGLIALYWALGVQNQATTVMQQIAGIVVLLIATISLAAAWLLGALQQIYRRLPPPQPEQGA